MVPYAALKVSRKLQVRDLLRECSRDDETSESLRVFLHEFGDEFEEIESMINTLERHGFLLPGGLIKTPD